jgi:hypothetical protein
MIKHDVNSNFSVADLKHESMDESTENSYIIYQDPTAPQQQPNLFCKVESWLKKNDRGAYLSKIFISLSIVVYLSCIVGGKIDKDKRRLEPTELGLAAILLLINSDLIGRLQEIKLGKDGIDLTLRRKVRSNSKVNQKESHALTYLGEVLLDKDKESQKNFFRLLLNDGDQAFLESFCEKKDLYFDKSDKSFENLLHLISLGFLDKKLEYEHVDCLIDAIPELDNIKKYYCLTEEGARCLQRVSGKTIVLDGDGDGVIEARTPAARLARLKPY